MSDKGGTHQYPKTLSNKRLSKGKLKPLIFSSINE